MIIHTTRIDLTDESVAGQLKVNGADIGATSVFLDLEHYIYKKPVCIGIFGAAVRTGDELVITQYFLENRADLKGLIVASHNYLLEMRQAGYCHLVTFAGQNDLMMLHAMFEKFKIKTDLRMLFESIDLQSAFKAQFHAVIGLNALEQFAQIPRQGPAIAGSTIAKTFANVVSDPTYIDRMPKEKIQRLLTYNQMDVENLYFILMNWGVISKPQVEDYLMALKQKNNPIQPLES